MLGNAGVKSATKTGSTRRSAPDRAWDSTLTIRSFAKINLDLRILHKRPDNFHELRTIFQTISLADTISIRFTPARRTRLVIEGNVDIPNNLILQAAERVLDAGRRKADLHITLTKRIPMGAGLGGGSSNAAAILLALPVLAGIHLPFNTLLTLGNALGSDVPFFLYGGTALGIGRGTEIYPFPEVRPHHGLLIAPDLHVSTAEAYIDLKRQTLTTTPSNSDTDSFRTVVWAMSEAHQAEVWKNLCINDFEGTVFRRHPALQSIKRKLGRCGARPALMTGSGSALFGLFDSHEQRENAFEAFSTQYAGDSVIFRMALLTQRRYRNLWRRQLAAHTTTTETIWPPQSRY